ncbi:MAG: 16S rRNA methyltransferase [Euryarchaeota archaeon]|nr:16S rRNA methyltransferase [Euryarchaeota archaeon]
MFHLILADSELETVPQELWSHPSVSKQARRRGKRPGAMVLDSNFHHSAISKYFPGDENRRGRPDIVHYFLLNCLESPLNISGKLRVYVHTRKNQVIFVDPSVKIPKSYNRFIGLIEDLFHNRYVPSAEKPLLKIVEMDIFTLIKNISPSSIFVLNEKGKSVRIKEILKDDEAIIIGGFPSGDFLTNVSQFSNISIFERPLPAWVVAFEVISEIERYLGIL